MQKRKPKAFISFRVRANIRSHQESVGSTRRPTPVWMVSTPMLQRLSNQQLFLPTVLPRRQISFPESHPHRHNMEHTLEQKEPLEEDYPDGDSNPQHNQEFMVAVGHATTCLRSTIPCFFSKGLQFEDIYAEDMIFTDPYATQICVSGKVSYRAMAETFRLAMNCYYTDVQVQILGVRQVDPSTLSPINGDGSDMSGQLPPQTTHEHSKDTPRIALQIRWIFTGKPRLKTMQDLFERASRSSQSRTISQSGSYSSQPTETLPVLSSGFVEYQGIFLYKFNPQGRVCEHCIQSIYPCPPIVTWFMPDDTIAPSSPSSF